jgi:hypothetical protein
VGKASSLSLVSGVQTIGNLWAGRMLAPLFKHALKNSDFARTQIQQRLCRRRDVPG